MTPEEASRQYDDIYAAAQKLFRDVDPCKIKPAKGDGITCTGGCGCCGGCQHLGPQGCTTDALACKLWVCGALENSKDIKVQAMVAKLSMLHAFVYHQQIPDRFRTSKEANFSGWQGWTNKPYIPLRLVTK